MKRLKFDHAQAELIRQGAKTSTWRIYDDKSLAVNDVVELIDKVSASNPATWVPIGVAQILSISEKRLEDMYNENSEGKLGLEKVLRTFRAYYGPQVMPGTPVKNVSFQLLPQSNNAETSDVFKTTKITEVKLYADGGSRGNPGPSASGYVITQLDGQIIVEKGIYLGVTTNNQAEYQALRFGMEEARRMGVDKLHVFMDSLLVINQMRGTFKVKNRDLWPVYESIKLLEKEFKTVIYTHIPRLLNREADGIVNKTLNSTAEAQA